MTISTESTHMFQPNVRVGAYCYKILAMLRRLFAAAQQER